jgi:hypothetical protein
MTAFHRIRTEHFLYEMGIHDRTEISDPIVYTDPVGNATTYSIVLGNSGPIAHTHRIYEIDKKNVILASIGHDYTPFYRFSFVLEDTLLHSHSASIVYYVMDDMDGNVSIYPFDLSKQRSTDPVRGFHTSVEAFHSHTMTVIRTPLNRR